jgi:TolA-binding protein
LNLGLSLIRQKRYADSISFLTKCLELKPGLSDAELRLGEALLESGKMDEADKHLTTAMQANDANRPEAMLKLAIVKVEKNDQAAAIKLLESYLVDYPKASNRAQVESILKQLRP